MCPICCLQWGQKASNLSKPLLAMGGRAPLEKQNKKSKFSTTDLVRRQLLLKGRHRSGNLRSGSFSAHDGHTEPLPVCSGLAARAPLPRGRSCPRSKLAHINREGGYQARQPFTLTKRIKRLRQQSSLSPLHVIQRTEGPQFNPEIWLKLSPGSFIFPFP